MLSKRLKSLTNYFNKDDKIIDIGCDHALIDIYLVQNNIVDKMIISDIHEGALQQGINNIKLSNLTESIDCRLGDGLTVLNDNDDIDTILISGMGATTIIDILNNDYINKINKMVIQSNNDHEKLRRYITSIGFIITNEEFLIDNNKKYINIVFERGNTNYSDEDYVYGPLLKHSEEYINSLIEEKNKILNNIPNDKDELRLSINKELEMLSDLLSR